MLKYISLMVRAYCNSTGTSEEEALKDLAIDGFVRASELEKNLDQEMIPTDKSGILSWKKEVAPQSQQEDIATIANIVTHCPHCRPLSGCLLSNLKGKPWQEIFTSLCEMTREELNQIIAFHQSCPYQSQIGL